MFAQINNPLVAARRALQVERPPLALGPCAHPVAQNALVGVLPILQQEM